MAYNVALQFEDGVTRIISCDDNQLVSDAAYRAKINIPLDCRDGACGTCKCYCESGSYKQGFYIEDALTDEEAAKGYILSCQMKPTSDCVIRVPASSHACKTQVMSFEAPLTKISRESPTTVVFSLQAEEPLNFLPGQYVNIKVPGTDKSRSYSFSSAPGLNQLNFLIRDVPNGLMSAYMRDKAQIGEQFHFEGPYGTFYLRPTIRPILMLAGGTGLAPFLSMLTWIRENRTDQPILLAYGVNTTHDLVELNLLEELKKDIDEFDYFTVVVDPASGHPKTGYITDHLSVEHMNGGDVDVYLCGPPAMVEAVRGWCKNIGAEPRNFLFEKFTSTNEAGHG
ncbi:MAG: ring-hydroxylating dioxygenase ferredoxin reductase family protein [Rhodocyclaceae bacterium]|nr:ring-hydroxylating dioxygenase ferredoxin reductase family protein [Rhodocyclaceae bacterium]MBX3667719.1 ring-hydroxylating dioxygenase ferredoxin reductase family protein [Rhodocyclaceae bacterium]